LSRQQEFPPGTSPDNSPASTTVLHPHYLKNIMTRLIHGQGGRYPFLERLPFGAGDSTKGTGTGLQTLVVRRAARPTWRF
jgi:hypothetical protein